MKKPTNSKAGICLSPDAHSLYYCPQGPLRDSLQLKLNNADFTRSSFLKAPQPVKTGNRN